MWNIFPYQQGRAGRLQDQKLQADPEQFQLNMETPVLEPDLQGSSIQQDTVQAAQYLQLSEHRQHLMRPDEIRRYSCFIKKMIVTLKLVVTEKKRGVTPITHLQMIRFN